MTAHRRETPSNLRELYIEKKMTKSEIASLFEVSYTQVTNWLYREDIKARRGGKRVGIHYEEKDCYKAKRRPATSEIAWAAGFIEGEGTFILRRRKKGFKRRSSYIAAFQVNREPLRRLKEMFGGSIYKYERKSKVNYNRDGSIANCKDISVWRAYGARARGIAMTLYSFLSKKRQRQARKIWQFSAS